MSNLLYSSSINYHLNETPRKHPEFNTPPTGAYEEDAIIFDEILQDYINGPFKQIIHQSYENFNFIKTNISIKKILFDVFKIQGIKNNLTYNITKQFSKKNIMFDYVNIQKINAYEIKKYSKQFYLKNIKLKFVNLQSLKPPKGFKLSRQINLKYVTVAKLQKIRFGRIQRDKLLWLLRSKNNFSDTYEYWSSENIDSKAPSGQGIHTSIEILGSYFQTGSQNLDQFGKNYTSSYINYDPLIPELGPTIELLTGSEDETGPLPDKQAYLHKINPQDIRVIKEQWNKRGTEYSQNKYKYWKEPELSIDSTNYSTEKESNEILGSNYE